MHASRFGRKKAVTGPEAIAADPKTDEIRRAGIAGETGDGHEATGTPAWTCPKCRAHKVFQRKRA